MTPSFNERLFRKFQRDETTAGSVPGTGLGLFIVQGLAAAMGGQAWYEPNEPRGACFGVTVPLVQPDGLG